MTARRFVAELGDQSYEVEVRDEHLVTVAGAAEAVSVRRVAPGELQILQGDRQRIAFVAGDTGCRWVFVDGDVFEIAVTPRGDFRRRTAGHHHESLTAPMPATVVTVAAPPGTGVRKGDVVLVLEAMKMELPILAPHDGIVEAIHCREGDLVQPGVPLADVEEFDDR